MYVLRRIAEGEKCYFDLYISISCKGPFHIILVVFVYLFDIEMPLK